MLSIARSPLHPVVVSLALAGVLSAAGCGGDDTIEPSPPVPTTITISPEAATLVSLEETVQLTATVHDQNGQVMTVPVAWASLDPSVATVGSDGRVTAARNGMASITASAGAATGTAAMTVEQRPAEVRITPRADTLVAIEDTLTLSVAVLDANGHPVANAVAIWASGDESVVTVDADGLVTAVGPGAASVTATAGEASGSATVSVEQRPAEVRVSPAGDTLLALGDTARFSAESLDANGHLLTNPEFAWVSGDESVATVDTAGLVTAVGWGSAAVTASTGEVSGSAEVAVHSRVTEVRVAPDADTLVSLGDTIRLSAIALDDTGSPIQGAHFVWTAVADSVVAVDGTGLVTAVANGTGEVTATFGATTGRATLTVVQEAVEVRLWLPRDTLLTADTVRAIAEVADANGHALEHAVFIWASSDVSVATVDARGLVTAVAAGTAEVRAVEVTNGLARSVPLQVQGIRGVLVELFGALGGEGWTNRDNWGTDAPIGEWYGVTTDEGGRIVKLELRNNGLEGAIPPAIARLRYLEVLDLSQNARTPEAGSLRSSRRVLPEPSESWRESMAGNAQAWGSPYLALEKEGISAFQLPMEAELCATDRTIAPGDLRGSIPPELGALENLRVLDLGYNHLEGPIPSELGNLEDLEVLDLAWNGLTGTIPPEFGTLRGLEVLNLCENRLGDAEQTGWLFPVELGDLHNLEVLHLGSSGLSGAIPPDIARLRKLRVLVLSAGDWGRVTGEIPSGIGRLESLEVLRLDRSSLSGSIPSALGALSELRVLDLSGDCSSSEGARLAGRIPTELFELTNLEMLDLSCNKLSGEIPPDLNRLHRLKVLDLSINARLEGGGWVGGLMGRVPLLPGSLEDLNLGANSFTGTIPAELGKMRNLVLLSFSANQLSGPIPPELGDLQNLLQLWLGGNKLTGEIPAELGNLPKLVSLSLGSNELTGPIPPELGDLQNLLQLWLGGNKLTGEIPAELGNMRSLVNLLLGSNELTGPIPPALGDLQELWQLQLGENQLTGPIPPELGDLTRLSSLGLGNNMLRGPIPPELGNLTELSFLTLGRNQLTGPLPSELAIETLRWLDIASTELTGRIPREFIAVPLSRFYWIPSDLCAPSDEEFQDWLDSIEYQSGGPNCPSGGYLGAGAQSREAAAREQRARTGVPE